MEKDEAVKLYERLKYIDRYNNFMLMPMLNHWANPTNKFFRMTNFLRWLKINAIELVKAGYHEEAKAINEFMRER